MTAGRYAAIGCKLKQNANEGCDSCASLAGLVLCFIACFILLVIAPLLCMLMASLRDSEAADAEYNKAHAADAAATAAAAAGHKMVKHCRRLSL